MLLSDSLPVKMAQEVRQDLLECYNPVPATPPAAEPSQPCYLWSPTTNALIRKYGRLPSQERLLYEACDIKELAFYNTLTTVRNNGSAPSTLLSTCSS